MGASAEQRAVRSDERQRISAVLDRLGEGSPLALQLAGEAGIGKTYLLGELLEDAGSRGYRAVAGRASELDPAPFGMFVEALDALLANDGGDVLENLDVDARRILRATVPGIAGEASAGQVAAYRLRRPVRLLLSAVAAGRPLVFALDDVHWADDEGLGLLAYLLRHPPTGPVLLVLSHRLPGLPVSVAAALGEASVETIDLRPLSFEDACRLLPDGLGEGDARRLWYDSGGNPLYLRELASAYTRGALQTDASMLSLPAGVPSVVAGSVGAELVELATDKQNRTAAAAVELVRAAAVLGDGFDFQIAAAVAGLDEELALAALDLLVERDLLRIDEVTARYRFRHPVVWRAVYHHFGEGQRLASHARAAKVLEARGAPLDVRAAHVARSASPGDRESAEVLAAAGEQAVLRAPALAAHWLAAALRLLPSHAEDQPRRQSLTFQLAVALAASGRLSDSIQTFRDLLAADDLQQVLRVPIVLGAAVVEHLLGAHDEAQALMLSTLEALTDPKSQAAALLRFGLAGGCYFDADWAGMREWAEQALATGHGDAVDRATGLGSLALACYGLGEVHAASEHAQEAARLVDTLPGLELASHLQGLAWLGWTEYCLGRCGDAQRHAERAIDISRATGQQHLEAPLLIIQGMAQLAQAQPDRAAEAAEAARESAERSSNQLFHCWALTLECMVETAHGDPRRAVPLGEAAVTVGRESHSPWAKVAGCYLADAYLEAGDPERARRQLTAAGDEPELPPLPFYHVHVYTIMAGAALAREQVDEAAAWAQRGLELAERLGLDALRAESRRVWAGVLLARGDAASATEHALAAAAAANQARLAVEAARALLIAAAAQTRIGDPRRAAEYAAAAQASGLTAHARRLVLRAQRYTRSLERRSLERGPERRPGLSALTPRERQMAELIAGHTNRRIAGELGVTEKTVEATLARVFAKLGVSSRREVVDIMERTPSP